jgi:hypothetical protein
MIHVQKIRKLIYNLLNYYELKETKYKKKYYYLYKSIFFKSEFECLSAEFKIGIDSKLTDKKAFICLNLLKMLHDRDYEYLLTIYTYIIDNDIFEENISFHETLNNPELWTRMLSSYYQDNEININKFNEIPRYLKNYKTKFKQRFYYIQDIKNYYFQLNKE